MTVAIQARPRKCR